MPNLFQLGDFKSAAGFVLPWKIECDALTQEDWECLAYMAVQKIPFTFGDVFGVPTGGFDFAFAMLKYRTLGAKRVLVVDDVWTTGKSWNEYADELVFPGAYGCVAFARQPTPEHIYSVIKCY